MHCACGAAILLVQMWPDAANTAMKKQRIGYELPGAECAAQQDPGARSEVDLEEIHLQLLMCSKCAKKSQKKGDFDPVPALQGLAVDVLPAKCFKQCKRGPNARLVRAGHEKGLVVKGMTEKEAKDKTFHEINSLTAAARVAKLIQNLSGADLGPESMSSSSSSSDS
eukprot:s665_g10.t1